MTKRDMSKYSEEELNKFLDRIIIQVEQLISELAKKDKELEQKNLEIVQRDRKIKELSIELEEAEQLRKQLKKYKNLESSIKKVIKMTEENSKKMKEDADYCLSIGADAVLYDLGATRPLLCTATNHDHKKPDEARVSRPMRFKTLRENIKAKGDFAIMQEHCIDVYTPYMDLVQPNAFRPRDKKFVPEMFLYTFPEVVMTNRENAMDEENMYDNINYSFIYNLRFDLSIARCCALPDAIPNYCRYMKEILNIRNQYSKYFVDGKFIDNDGFETDGDCFEAKAYLSKEGKLGVAVWNASDSKCTQNFINKATGKVVSVSLDKDNVCFVEI